MTFKRHLNATNHWITTYQIQLLLGQKQFVVELQTCQRMGWHSAAVSHQRPLLTVETTNTQKLIQQTLKICVQSNELVYNTGRSCFTPRIGS